MPLYEYECEACRHRFENIQKFSDPPLDRCPKCGGSLHKLQSAPAFHLKGSGWYITDYARKDSGSTGAESKTDAAAGDAKADSKTEATTGAKTDTKDNAPADAKSKAAAPPASSDTKPTS